MDKPKKALKSCEAAPAPAKTLDAKAKAKAGAHMAMLLPFSIKVSNSFSSISNEPIEDDIGRDSEKTSQTVKFAKKENRVAHRHGKYPSYLKYVPYHPAKTVTEFQSAEAIKHYESWYRDKAYRLHREIKPEDPSSREAFFPSKGSTLLLASGEPSPSDEKCAPRTLKPTRFAARANKHVVRDLTREYMVDSGASFHLVSEDSVTI